MKRSIPFVLFASIFLLPMGCSKQETANVGTDTGAADNAVAQVAPAAPTPVAQEDADQNDVDLTGNTGRVLSSVDVPGYTYIEVENNDRIVWIAGNPVKVYDGEIISWDQSTVMRNFYSKTLQRTFEEVIFVARIRSSIPQAKTMPRPMPSSLPVTGAPRMPTLARGAVVSVQNAANYSYLEVKTADDELVWLAAPETQVSVDDTVEWQEGSLMRNFKSSTLGKTFPEIYFVAAVQIKN